MKNVKFILICEFAINNQVSSAILLKDALF